MLPLASCRIKSLSYIKMDKSRRIYGSLTQDLLHFLMFPNRKLQGTEWPKITHFHCLINWKVESIQMQYNRFYATPIFFLTEIIILRRNWEKSRWLTMAVNHNEANEQLRIYHNVLEKMFSCFAVSGGGRFVLQRAFSSISFESLHLFFAYHCRSS